MADTRLTGSDKRALLLWIICGVLGLVFAQRYFFRAFPEASVDFKVTRNVALEHAKTFVQGLFRQGRNMRPAYYGEPPAFFDMFQQPVCAVHDRSCGCKTYCIGVK